MKLQIFITVIILLLAGCAHQPFSQETLKQVDPAISFAMLRENPENYVGRKVLLGGVIAKIRNTPEGGEIEAVQVRVDEDGRPEDTGGSGGRFLARGKTFFDPLIFNAGMLVSLVGEVKGKETMPLDRIDYTYPVIAIKELYLWKPEELYPASPVFQFGIGVYHGF